MKKIAYFAAALAALPSIASAQDGPPLPDDMPPANAPMPAGGGAQVDPNAYISPRNPNLTRTQREGLSSARRWQAESAEGIKPVPGTEGAVLFAFGTSEPSVVCAVLQICDVQLQPGENINSVNVGDSAGYFQFGAERNPASYHQAARCELEYNADRDDRSPHLPYPVGVAPDAIHVAGGVHLSR